MDLNSTLISIDNDETLLGIAQKYLGDDERLELTLTDGKDWIIKNKSQKFDYIFADTWHGKYLLLENVLEMLTKGGLYIVDDMLPQLNWPEGHNEKAFNFVNYLESRADLILTKQKWSTGVIICVKK